MAHLSVTAVCFILVLVPLVAAWPPNFHNWFADICDNRALLNANAYAQSFVANTTLSTVYSVHGIGTVFYPKPTPAAGIGGPTVSRGIIFLPEVCVDPVAYAPHLSVVNTDGYIAILLDPTGVDDDDYQRAYGKALAAMDLFGPQIQYWAVGGHGRAAALASRIAQAAYPKVKGLYLLAGAIDDDVNLSSLYMTVAVIYGTADTVIPASTILATKSRLPDHAYFQAIPGAGHSDFGFYDGWRDPGCGALNQTAVMAILSAPCTNAVVPTGPAIVRVVLQGLHIPKVMPEALAYACNSDLCDYVYVPGRYYAFVPKNTASVKTGLVYHVGAFCDSRAYFPAMRAIADKGFVVVIPIFPMNYVLSNITLTTDVVNDFPYVTRWVSSGHSLGVVAAGYVGFQNPTKFVGMLFHDSAPRTNVSTYPGPIAITYGARPGTGARLPTDSLLYTAYVAVNKLPKSTQFYPIEGGNHYQFGWYNDQPGMPPANISRQVQTQLVVESALMFLLPWFNLP